MQPDATELSKADMVPCREEEHCTVMSCSVTAMSSVLMVQQCVLNNVSEQKCTQNKITYRRAEESVPRSTVGPDLQFPPREMLRIH